MDASKVWFLGLIFVSLLCCLSTAFGGERFTDNGDGTVTDHQLGVMWSQTDNHGDIAWRPARQWARYTFPYTLPGKYEEGWRLPTLKELQSLYVRDDDYDGYETDCGQEVKIVSEIRLTCGWVWTSEHKTITALVFNFQRGYHYMDRMVHKRAYRVLPVRSLKSSQ
ncbi:MAG: DUF1566 domain-containing protein [Deltaproteobacteria bacterium]|jgi:hypothetical protein|nr:DUF1566 domain-containing protein [Deltaproteobacteria bacterium]